MTGRFEKISSNWVGRSTLPRSFSTLCLDLTKNSRSVSFAVVMCQIPPGENLYPRKTNPPADLLTSDVEWYASGQEGEHLKLKVKQSSPMVELTYLPRKVTYSEKK